MKKNLDLLKGLFGEQVTQLNEEQTTQISERLDKLVESRVNAKVRFQTEIVESEAKEKYDALLTEATAKYKKNIKQLEEQMVAKASNFKKTLEKANKTKLTTIEEGKSKEIESFKETIVEKLDKYLNLELNKKVPETFIESVAKVEVLEPIVEGFKKVMNDNYIKFDEENFGLLKDARGEIVKTHKENTKLVKENMEISSQLQTLKRSAKISKVCEGLTAAQREKAVKLLESYDVDEIEDRLNDIRDIVISSSSSKSSKKTIKEETGVKNGEEKEEEKLNSTGVPTQAVSKEKEEDEDEKEEEVDESLNPRFADREAVSDDSRLIESWAKEFKRISL